MIKARGTMQNGTPLLVFGLSFANLDRLRSGEAIEFDGSPYGISGHVFIFAGQSENEMAGLLRAGAGPDFKEHLEQDAP